jgi:glycyl-tRNA synthetase alpha chain
MEISQFTYFQQVGSVDVFPISVELTYGLERLAMYIQDVADYRQLAYSKSSSYAELYFDREVEYSAYNFEQADTGLLFELFARFESESQKLISQDLVYPAYDMLLKSSHTFNLLDARGVISVTERAAYIGKIRNLAKACAGKYIEKYAQEEQ